MINVAPSVSEYVHRVYRKRLRLLKPLGVRRAPLDVDVTLEEQVEFMNRFRTER